MLDTVNQHVAKIILATADGDSINRIAKKTRSSYGWTHHWIERLAEIGVIERDDGVRITDQPFAESFESVAKTVLRRAMELEDAYLLPNFTGLEYAYTKTDAVYHWTRGGYQIGRSQSDYPIFIDVLEADVEAWQQFFAEFGLATRIEDRSGEGIYFVLFPREGIEAEWQENASVIPLQDTVDWMKQYAVNFEPALEMVDEMYDLDLGFEYRERAMG